MTSQNSICRLCCDHIEEKNILIINNSTQVMLQTLLINIDIAANEHSVICETCHRKLENNYCFKKKCLFTEDTLRPFVVENVKINLSEIRNEVIKAGCVEMEKNVCRLCLEYCDDDMLLNEDENQQFCNFFPEINLNLTHFVVLCLTCYNALQKYFMFVMSCSQSEGSLSRYPADNNSKEDYDINSENCQIAVKSEDVKKVELLDDGIEIKHEGDSYDLLEENWYTTNFVDCAQINDIKSENIQLDNEEDDKRLILNQELDIKCDADSSDEKCLYSNPGSIISNKPRPDGVQTEKQPLPFKNYEESDPDNSGMKCATYRCDECDYQSKQKRNLKNHYLAKHTDPSKVQMYKCQECDYKSKQKRNLKNHIITKHTDPVNAQMHQCEECDYKSVQKSNLKKHILTQHTGAFKAQIFNCEECDYKSKYKIALNRHFLARHTDHFKVSIHKCEKCDYKSKRKGNLRNHVLARHTDPSKICMYKCEECDYRSKQKGDLKKHIFAKHTDPSKVQMHKCEECDYKSIHNVVLKRHILAKHTDPCKVLRYQCNKCEYITKHRTALKTHILLQHLDPSKVKKYKCDIESEADADPSRIQTCKCDKCEYKCTRKGNLKRHILAMHVDPSKIPMHKCQECDYKSKNRGDLKKHILSKHTDPSKVQMHTCEECDYKVKHKGSLRKHILEKHRFFSDL